MTVTGFQHHADFQSQMAEQPLEALLPVYLAQLNTRFDPVLLDQSLIESFPPQVLIQNQLVPLFLEQKTLFLGTLTIEPDLAKSLSQAFQCSIQLVPVSPQCMQAFLEALASQAPESPLPAVTGTEPQALSAVFQMLLGQAKQYRASDIHIEPQADHSVLIRFRIDGLLHDVKTLSDPDFAYSTRLVSKIKVAADLDIAETRVPQDGRITEVIRNEPVDLRVSTLPSLHGEKIVIRLLPHKNPFQELRDLGLEGEALLTYYNWIKKPQGMVLITGQTGSGKTSTLYTTLSHILHAEKNIVTIEDPIEYQLKGVTQVQVHPKVGLTFANGLRSILRQDPDTILLGEIRDAETAEIAYQAALTGHMVLSTLHTNDAPSAIIRLMDIQVEPYLIVSATLGVVAQRLIRRVCSHCAQPYTPARDLIRSLGLDSRQDYLFYRAIGCEQCFQTGYYGREGIFEVMPVDDELATLISQKDQLSQLRQHLQRRKLQSLFESAIGKVVQGLTTVDEVYRIVPPVQQAQQLPAQGSVLIFILFLMSILSILILNTADLFGSRASVFKVQKEALQGTYASQAALQAAEAQWQARLNSDHWYMIADPPSGLPEISNPLLQVPEFSDLLQQEKTVVLEAEQIESHYNIHVTSTPAQQPGLLDYQYQITANTVLSGRTDKTVSPTQQLSGNFQVEIGALPLSFFERFASDGSIQTQPTSANLGPWYSPQAPIPKSVSTPRHGYFQASAHPFVLPPTVWPVIGDAKADSTVSPARPSIYLTPIASGQGRSRLQGNGKDDAKAFTPHQGPWAISVYGNVDRLVLSTSDANSQKLEFNQLLAPTVDTSAKGYQTLTLFKTLIEEDLGRKHIGITTQQWMLTLNPQKQVINQTLSKTLSESFEDGFSGLVLVNGAIQQLVTESASGQNAYARPLSFFASNDIGLPATLLKHTASPQATLGLVTAEGRIQFEPLQPPPLAIWKMNPGNFIRIEAALAASNYQLPAETVVLIQGSVAALKSGFPAGLQTESNPQLYSLTHFPPFYPRLNPGEQALLVTQVPTHQRWQEVREP